MERGNGNTVLLTVIGVATLLVALVGATFAYFTASITTDTNNVEVTTSTLANLVMTQEKENPTLAAIYPGYVGYDVVQVAASGNTGNKANYDLSFAATVPTEFGSDIKYSVCKVTNTTTPKESTIYAASATDTKIGYVEGSLLAERVGNESHYSITGSSVALPTDENCVAVGTANSALTSSTTITLASNKQLVVADTNATVYDIYYIIYQYTNNTSATQSAQGLTFTLTPTFTVRNGAAS